MKAEEFYRRRLPHWQPPSSIIFLTYRLYGSLPAKVIQRLAEEKQRMEKEPSHPNESRRERALREGNGLFKLADDALDIRRIGPQWLFRRDIATIVLENLFFQARNLYRLWAFVIMPNHVHLLIEPSVMENTKRRRSLYSNLEEEEFTPLPRITHALESYTANRANKVLKRKGTFWQEESYDHWIRDKNEFERIVQYIENNPVKAALAVSLNNWQWSSAVFERAEDGSCINSPRTG